MAKHLEIKTIEHKGIKVRVRLDYDNNDVSLIDENNDKKKWVFASRGVEYMRGWLDILEAMTFAVKECKKEMEQDAAEKQKVKDKLMMKAMKEVAESPFRK